ncbi:DUF2975 domain-containing protein [Chitinophaga sancti]|uniref:DUF2975 domain-containing protein n=1 Tax=Chitinophaga sancti TaxID=1004 RepID=A0A1K1S0W9_9BACT|nr:DUF2975 domain-containing protein [Chitinophaga sancti]WQD59789.1 DUF2975 domain-containing protein [Chitinophaga sancti]WQG88080.1 DUF2975 domain-containing protein [Chitinophaga sancti]SFW77727.1 Protein of unknown function [Chitinophaga sancti]
MKPKNIIAIFKVLTTIGFYFLLCWTIVFSFFSIVNITANNPLNHSAFTSNNYKVMAFGVNKAKSLSEVVFSADKQLRYQLVENEYNVQITPSTPFGYYTMFMTLIHFLMGIFTLWTFRKILKELQLDAPFNGKIVRRLKNVAAVFVIADIVNVINNIIFNQYLHQQVPALAFKLESEVGSGFVIGAITWVVAVIYQRGVELQTYNDLTV